MRLMAQYMSRYTLSYNDRYHFWSITHRVEQLVSGVEYGVDSVVVHMAAMFDMVE